MIRILRASLSTRRRKLAWAVENPRAIYLQGNAEFAVPWQGARSLVAQLRCRFGDREIATAITPSRALLSLVLRGLEPDLTEEDRAERELAKAHALGFMSHSGVARNPLVTAWATTLAPLLAGRISALVIPDVATLDRETLMLIRELYRRMPAGSRIEVILGQDPSGRLAGGDDVVPTMQHALHLSLLEALEDTVVESPVESANPVMEEPGVDGWEQRRDPLDDGLECRAWEALCSAPRSPDSEVCELVFSAMRAAFSAFGFPATLRLGRELLAREPVLSQEATAELHTLVAVSGYNCQVEGRDAALAEFLEQHFVAACAVETDPLRRSHLLYRLCINAGRRQRQLDQALEYAEQAIHEAGRPGLPAGLAAFIEAWARNGRAYVLGRLHRWDEAVADCIRAHDLIQADVLPGAPAGEIPISRVVLLSNLAELALLSGDVAGASRWQQRMEQAEARLPTRVQYSTFLAVRIHRAEGRLRQAIQAAERGLSEARAQLNALAEERYAAELGDLCYRIGDAEASRRHLLLVLAIQRRIGTPEDLLRTEIGAALAAARSGHLEEAERDLGRLFAHSAFAAGAPRAEILAEMGTIAARRKNAAEAKQYLNDAIAQAVDTGERDILVLVARAAGEVSLGLGEREEAREAFQRALAIAEKGSEGCPPPAVEIVRVLLGLWDASDDPDLPLRALRVAPDALRDGEAWWELPRLLHALVATSARVRIRADANLEAALRQVMAAAAQRSDCSEQIAVLEKMIEPAQ